VPDGLFWCRLAAPLIPVGLAMILVLEVPNGFRPLASPGLAVTLLGMLVCDAARWSLEELTALQFVKLWTGIMLITYIAQSARVRFR